MITVEQLMASTIQFGVIYYEAVSFPAVQLATKWLQRLTCTLQGQVWPEEKITDEHSQLHTESHDSTSEKRVIWNRTGFILQGEQKLSTPTYSSDVKNDLRKGLGSWRMARAKPGAGSGPNILNFIPRPILLPWRPILCHGDAPSPRSYMWTSVSWSFLGTVSQNIPEVPWFISVTIYGYSTWTRKEL